uniref:Uncharacterized protein n=1 Tax=Stegastes partitus TaxID=144197 RepID=A0A3B5AN99_9TELE
DRGSFVVNVMQPETDEERDNGERLADSVCKVFLSASLIRSAHQRTNRLIPQRPHVFSRTHSSLTSRPPLAQLWVSALREE